MNNTLTLVLVGLIYAYVIFMMVKLAFVFPKFRKIDALLDKSRDLLDESMGILTSIVDEVSHSENVSSHQLEQKFARWYEFHSEIAKIHSEVDKQSVDIDKSTKNVWKLWSS